MPINAKTVYWFRDCMKSNHEDAKHAKRHKEAPGSVSATALFVPLCVLCGLVVGLFKQLLGKGGDPRVPGTIAG